MCEELVTAYFKVQSQYLFGGDRGKTKKKKKTKKNKKTSIRVAGISATI
jgi:hypothetical protein